MVLYVDQDGQLKVTGKGGGGKGGKGAGGRKSDYHSAPWSAERGRK